MLLQELADNYEKCLEKIGDQNAQLTSYERVITGGLQDELDSLKSYVGTLEEEIAKMNEQFGKIEEIVPDIADESSMRSGSIRDFLNPTSLRDDLKEKASSWLNSKTEDLVETLRQKLWPWRNI